mmetsp:Transcript_66112/g.187760  ORF Transcript_66112/g.187760 Transcript_66112/m.187760 type:complete len:256 (+) Transcript_66112:178-945(+)
MPVPFVRVIFFLIILAMLVYPGPPDEFQLINYILLFKGTQFLNAGLFSMSRGAMQYFLCFSMHKEDLLGCVRSTGPGAKEALWPGIFDYFGSCLLVWIAFSVLPYSKKYVRRTYMGRNAILSEEDEFMEDEAETVRCCCFSWRSVRTTGGRLRHLLRYDVKCFLFSLLILFLVTAWTASLDDTTEGLLEWIRESPQFKEDFFWCKVLYGMLSLPFLPFMIPIFCQVLTHCEFTGYNERGACVEFSYPPMAAGPRS